MIANMIIIQHEANARRTNIGNDMFIIFMLKQGFEPHFAVVNFTWKFDIAR